VEREHSVDHVRLELLHVLNEQLYFFFSQVALHKSELGLKVVLCYQFVNAVLSFLQGIHVEFNAKYSQSPGAVVFKNVLSVAEPQINDYAIALATAH